MCFYFPAYAEWLPMKQSWIEMRSWLNIWKDQTLNFLGLHICMHSFARDTMIKHLQKDIS